MRLVCWYYADVMLVLWCCAGIMLVLYWFVLVPCWYYVAVMLVFCCCRDIIMLVLYWYYVGVMLVLCWCRTGILPVPWWHYAGIVSIFSRCFAGLQPCLIPLLVYDPVQFRCKESAHLLVFENMPGNLKLISAYQFSNFSILIFWHHSVDRKTKFAIFILHAYGSFHVK